MDIVATLQTLSVGSGFQSAIPFTKISWKKVTQKYEMNRSTENLFKLSGHRQWSQNVTQSEAS